MHYSSFKHFLSRSAHDTVVQSLQTSCNESQFYKRNFYKIRVNNKMSRKDATLGVQTLRQKHRQQRIARRFEELFGSSSPPRSAYEENSVKSKTCTAESISTKKETKSEKNEGLNESKRNFQTKNKKHLVGNHEPSFEEIFGTPIILKSSVKSMKLQKTTTQVVSCVENINKNVSTKSNEQKDEDEAVNKRGAKRKYSPEAEKSKRICIDKNAQKQDPATDKKIPRKDKSATTDVATISEHTRISRKDTSAAAEVPRQENRQKRIAKRFQELFGSSSPPRLVSENNLPRVKSSPTVNVQTKKEEEQKQDLKEIKKKIHPRIKNRKIEHQELTFEQLFGPPILPKIQLSD